MVPRVAGSSPVSHPEKQGFLRFGFASTKRSCLTRSRYSSGTIVAGGPRLPILAADGPCASARRACRETGRWRRASTTRWPAHARRGSGRRRSRRLAESARIGEPHEPPCTPFLLDATPPERPINRVGIPLHVSTPRSMTAFGVTKSQRLLRHE